MLMVTRRVSCDCSRVVPAMTLDMAVGERKHAATIVQTAREIEKDVSVHSHTEVRPADAILINILKQKRASWHGRRGNLRMLSKHFVVRREPIIPGPFPAHVGIQRVASESREILSVDFDHDGVGRTNIHFGGLKVLGEQGIAGIKNESFIGTFSSI